MIFVLIAGSYTPFGLLVLRGTLGAVILITVWSAALAGAAICGRGVLGAVVASGAVSRQGWRRSPAEAAGRAAARRVHR